MPSLQWKVMYLQFLSQAKVDESLNCPVTSKNRACHSWLQAKVEESLKLP